MLRDLSPDDVLVVSCDLPVAVEVADRIKAVLRHELKSSAQRVLVFDRGLTLDVLPVRPPAENFTAELVETDDAVGVAALRDEIASVWKRMDALLDEVATTDAAVEVLRAELKKLAGRA